MGYRHWPLPNVNIGTSAENQRRLLERFSALLDVPIHSTAHRFLSLEPLLSPIIIGPNLSKVGAVISSLERGAGSRPGEEEWLEDLRTECRKLAVPFFHSGSAVLERQQRPASDREMREHQCEQRLREYRNGGRSLVPELKEIARREGITWSELMRRISSRTAHRRSYIFKGLIEPCAYPKLWAYVNNYNATRGEADASST